MNLLYVGSLNANPDRDSQWIKCFSDLGFLVHSFSIWDFVKDRHGFLGRLHGRLHLGPEITMMRKELIKTVKNLRPDWVHFRLPLEFDKATIQEVKDHCSLVTEYCNDDPCSPQRLYWLWRLYDETIPLFDAHFVYRKRNIDDLKSLGAQRVFHTPPCYVPWRHQPPVWQQGEYQQWHSDAAFVGHWESDNRLDAIDALINAGFKITLRGSGWNRPGKGRACESLMPITPVFGADYNKIYAATAAGLCFFSKLNRDQLTERALEIPAIGGLLVCERTDEVERLFNDRKEAFFFSDNSELIEIVREVSLDDNLRNKVSNSGRIRLMREGHSVMDRAQQIISFLITSGLLRASGLNAGI